MLKPKSYRSLKDALSKTQRDYRRAIWDSQNVYVEFWAESDAVAGVLYDVTAKWDVPLMVSRGYSSLTFLQSAAIDIASIDKPAYLYHFGDHDPSGRDIGRHIEFTIREFAPEADVHFVTVAVTPAQIKKWNLPSRPTKKSDTRAKGFVGNSVEIEAIPVKKLRDLAERCILKHIDQWTLDRLQTVENTERDTLKTILQQFQESNVDA